MQESQQLKESLLIISLKLRWLLKQWRLGKKLDTESKDILEVWNLFYLTAEGESSRNELCVLNHDLFAQTVNIVMSPDSLKELCKFGSGAKHAHKV